MRRVLSFISRYPFWIITSAVVLMFAFLGLFLYNNLYKAITETEVIVTLRTQYAVEPVNFSAYRALQGVLRDKKESPRTDWQALRDPFRP